MKLYGLLLTGAVGYTIGCKMGMMRKTAQRSMKEMKRMTRMMRRKMGL